MIGGIVNEENSQFKLDQSSKFKGVTWRLLGGWKDF
jgi:hypothetical protein